MLPSTGGTVGTVSSFTRAVPSRVVALTDPTALACEGSAIDGTLHLSPSADWRGRWYDWIPQKEAVRFEVLGAGAAILVCHILYRYHVHLTRWVARRYCKPYWVLPHGSLDPYAFSYRKWQKQLWMSFIGRSFLRDAASVVCATERERQKIAARYPSENLVVIHWPVDRIDRSDVAGAKIRVRRELRIGINEKILLYVGRLHPMKRPLETIEAVAAAREPGVHLVVMGPPEIYSTDDCCNRARELGMSGVHVIGPVYGERKRDFLLSADGYISLSFRENFGIAAAEAMMAGLPVILSPGNDLAHDAAAARNGWTLRSDSQAEAIEAIREFSGASPDTLRAMGENGRRWAEAWLSLDRFQSKVIALMEATLAMHGKH